MMTDHVPAINSEGPSTAVCSKCGLDLIHEGGWWQATQVGVDCPAGDHHYPSPRDVVAEAEAGEASDYG